MKKSMVLLELIFVIILLSIIFLTTTKFLFAIYDKNKINYTTNLTKIEFETTKLFLIKNLENDTNLNNLNYSDEKLFYDSNLLQDKVTSFNLSQDNNIYTINICINLYNNICQTWIIR